MKIRFVIAVLVIVCIAVCAVVLLTPDSKDDTFISTIGISDITNKYIADQPYVTVVLDDDIVEEYSLDFNEVTIAVEKSVYDKITLDTGYCGMSVMVTIPDDLLTKDVFVILKAKRIENLKIIGVSEG